MSALPRNTPPSSALKWSLRPAFITPPSRRAAVPAAIKAPVGRVARSTTLRRSEHEILRPRPPLGGLFLCALLCGFPGSLAGALLRLLRLPLARWAPTAFDECPTAATAAFNLAGVTLNFFDQ